MIIFIPISWAMIISKIITTNTIMITLLEGFQHTIFNIQVGDSIWRDSFQTENEKTTLVAEKMSTMV